MSDMSRSEYRVAPQVVLPVGKTVNVVVLCVNCARSLVVRTVGEASGKPAAVPVRCWSCERQQGDLLGQRFIHPRWVKEQHSQTLSVMKKVFGVDECEFKVFDHFVGGLGPFVTPRDVIGRCEVFNSQQVLDGFKYWDNRTQTESVLTEGQLYGDEPARRETFVKPLVEVNSIGSDGLVEPEEGFLCGGSATQGLERVWAERIGEFILGDDPPSGRNDQKLTFTR
jgi:hypothetical protein